MRVLALPLLLLLKACAGSPAFEDPAMVEFRDFLRADADNSGKLSLQEARAFPAVARQFARFDADADGLIAWNELRRAHGVELDARSRFEAP